MPVALAIVASVGIAIVALPIAGLIARAPWGRIGEIAADEATLEALRLSIVVSTVAAALALATGFPIAWILARVPFRGQVVVRALVVLPLVMPPVVAGVGLLAAFGRRGVVGGWLDRWFDVQVTFTTGAAVLAATFVALPLAVLALESGLRSIDDRLEGAAATLGASRWYVIRRVVLPLLVPQIAAAAVLAWARALGEFGATITFAGNLRGRTQTLPLAVFERLQTDPEAAFALSAVLIALALTVIIALRGRFLR